MKKYILFVGLCIEAYMTVCISDNIDQQKNNIKNSPNNVLSEQYNQVARHMRLAYVCADQAKRKDSSCAIKSLETGLEVVKHRVAHLAKDDIQNSEDAENDVQNKHNDDKALLSAFKNVSISSIDSSFKFEISKCNAMVSLEQYARILYTLSISGCISLQELQEMQKEVDEDPVLRSNLERVLQEHKASVEDWYRFIGRRIRRV